MMERPRSAVPTPIPNPEPCGSGLLVRRLCKESIEDAYGTPHRDDYYIFGIVLSGAASVAVDFAEVAMRPGNVIVITPGQVFRVQDVDDDSVGYMLGLPPDMLAEAEIGILNKYSLFPEPIELDQAAKADALQLFGILQRRPSAHLAKSIVEIVIPYIHDKEQGKTGRHLSLFTMFKALLDKNIRATKRPSDYASMLSITEIYLNEVVRRATGQSVSRYIMSQAVLCAKRLFVNTTLSAKQIALHLGYDDYTYFSKLFKKIEGVTPADFRKNLK